MSFLLRSSTESIDYNGFGESIELRTSFKDRLEADPKDHQARYDLASALNAMGERDQAAEALLDIVRRDRKWNEDAARLQLLKFFEAWGNDEPATGSARRRLSAVLFS